MIPVPDPAELRKAVRAAAARCRRKGGYPGRLRQNVKPSPSKTRDLPRLEVVR